MNPLLVSKERYMFDGDEGPVESRVVKPAGEFDRPGQAPRTQAEPTMAVGRLVSCPGELLRASQARSHVHSVLLTTGFPVYFNYQPPDRLPGAVALAAILQALEKRASMVFDQRALSLHKKLVDEAAEQGEAPKIQEEAGEAGCWRSEATDFVDPSLGLRIPGPSCGCPAPCSAHYPSPGCSFLSSIPSTPRFLSSTGSCLVVESHSSENEDTHLPLTTWALSFSETPWSEESKGTDGTDLRSEQDEFKMLKGRDRNRQDTNAVLLLSFVQWAVVNLENCSEKIPQGVDLRRLVIHNDHKEEKLPGILVQHGVWNRLSGTLGTEVYRLLFHGTHAQMTQKLMGITLP
ncbi:unnamed protein product [Rangifer tarandus platyrhynchus]|uniref:D-glutamate cyclase-like C-terminal domain-containing protein n=1 Tax=Rangifer tarandus platyrhynchus TaxID=3082113 RepID=A0ABN8YBV4_RANTA|nr:unnamed protein product [Rangifer tarandus platyrhynchus]